MCGGALALARAGDIKGSPSSSLARHGGNSAPGTCFGGESLKKHIEIYNNNNKRRGSPRGEGAKEKLL